MTSEPERERNERKEDVSVRAEQLFIEIGIPIASAYLLDLILMSNDDIFELFLFI